MNRIKTIIKNKNLDRSKLSAVAALLLCTVFFMGFAIADGPVWCVDSESYATMNISREPFYPLFLAFFRFLFGETKQMYGQPLYLFPAILVQSALWIWMVWNLGQFCSQMERRMQGGNRKAEIARWCAVLPQLFVCLLNRFAAARSSMYSECIMTESLAMPLYVLLTVHIFRWHISRNKVHFGMALLDSLLLLLIRKQMAVGLLLLLGASFFYDLLTLIHKKRDKNTGKANAAEASGNTGAGTGSFKRFVLTAICCVLVLVSSGLLEKTYNYVLRGHAVQHTGNAKAMFCMLTYTATEEDAALFDGDNAQYRELFLQIMEQCSEKSLLMEEEKAQDPDWLTMETHFAESYDEIGFTVAQPLIYAYVDANWPGLDTVQREMKYDEVMGGICKVLLHQDLGDLGYLFLINMADGIVASNAQMIERLIVPSLLIYLLYIVLLLMTLQKKKRELAIPAFLTLLGIALNIVLVAALIFPQPRYMTYGMGCFYTMLLWMGMENLKLCHRK